MTGENVPEGWRPSPKFFNEFAQEISRCFDFFDKEPETFYKATADLSQMTREVYDWKKAAKLWEEIVKVVTKKVTYNDEWISNKVPQENEYEVDTFSPDDIVIDIGAHKGFFAKLCVDKGCKQIHCFEPEQKNFEALVNNSKDCKYIQPYNLAVFDKMREKEFNVVPGENTGMHSFYQKGITTKVRAIGLDDILINFPKVSLIKVDAEGSEYEILMKSKLLFKVEKIVGEYHDDLTDKTHKELFAYLESKNFTIQKVTPWNATSGIFIAKQNTYK
jgi:FkbM family methyltransferase